MIPKVLFENDGELSIEDIRMGMAKVGKRENNKTMFAILNKDGEFVSDFQYEIVRLFSEGYAVVAESAKSCSNEKGIATIKAKYGLIDKEGNLAVPMEYEELGSFRQGLINAKKDGLWGYIDSQGNTKVNFRYEDAHPFYEGLAAVKKFGKYGFIDINGNLEIDYRFIWTHDFSDGVCFVQSSCASATSSLIYINKKGKVVVRIKNDIFGKYGMPSDYNEGVMVLNRTKVVSKEGMIQFELNDRYRIKNFHEGVACVYDSKNDTYGYINTEGKFIVPCKYENSYFSKNTQFEDGMIGIQNKNKMWGIIGYNGKTLLPQEYSGMYGYSDGRVLVKKDNSVYSINIK